MSSDIERLAAWLARAFESPRIKKVEVARRAHISPRQITALLGQERRVVHDKTLDGLERAFGLHAGDLRAVMEGEDLDVPDELPPDPDHRGRAERDEVAELRQKVERIERQLETVIEVLLKDPAR